MCVAPSTITTFAIPFPFSTIANEQNYRPRVSLHHLPYAYEPVRIHRSYTVYGISASCEQSHLNIRWGVPLLYVERIRFTIYPLPWSLISIPIPVFRAPYIYTLKLRPKVIFFSIYIYTLYIYDSTYTISVDCAGATLVALLYIYVIRIILKGIYVYVLRLRFSPCENLAQSALAFGLEFIIYIRISYTYYIYVLRIR